MKKSLFKLGRVQKLSLFGRTRSIRGKGFPGDGTQRLRSQQIEIIHSLTNNETFISQYPELLTCNESWISIADKVDVAAELEAYFKSSWDWMNYPGQVPALEGWIDSKGHVWPNIHPTHQQVVNIFCEFQPKSVCEIGAGAGVVSKYVYAASNQKILLTCIEGGENHLEAMKINFSEESKVIPPYINVPAEIKKGLAQSLTLENDSHELVFTCTVMMHMPFIAAVLAACEIARVSSRYVLHVEGYHTDGIVEGFRTPYNLLIIDYERLYEKLGFHTLKKFFYQDPYSESYEAIVFLAEKIKRN